MNRNFWSCQFREPVIVINLVVQALLRVSKPDLVYWKFETYNIHTYAHMCAHTDTEQLKLSHINYKTLKRSFMNDNCRDTQNRLQISSFLGHCWPWSLKPVFDLTLPFLQQYCFTTKKNCLLCHSNCTVYHGCTEGITCPHGHYSLLIHGNHVSWNLYKS